jgi:aromatic-L-amino-acid/L-tryptophan decarboxylase
MYPLEPGADEMRRMGRAAVEYLTAFIEGLEDAPANNVEHGLEVAERIRAAPPEQGVPFETAMREFADGVQSAYEPAGPGYLAYIPGGGLYAAALASFLAAGVNRFVNLAGTAPAFVQVEENVLRWLCETFDLPPGSRGILTSGGSMANFSAIVTARRAKLPEDFLRGTLYVSGQVHASVTKAASLAGFPAANVRRVPVTQDLRLDARACADMVREDRGSGMEPFFVVASAGTTNTGAVDPVDELATLCADEGMWLHADAAYGGFFQLTERGRKRFRGIERADSITLDPHKGMFLPYGTGSLLVRDGSLLREAHYSGAAYLQDVVAGGEVLPNFSEYSPELSRDFRGLRVWLPLQLHGVAAFRDALDEKLDLARVAYDGLRGEDRLDLPWDPELSIVAFRLAPPPGAGAEEEDDRNRALLERINASKRVFLSSTMVEGRFTLRLAILSHRTHRDRIDEAIEIIRNAAAAVVG